jgi:putative aldouronate transport system substrate-binding protein
MKKAMILLMALNFAGTVFGGGGSQQTQRHNTGKGDLTTPGSLSILVVQQPGAPLSEDMPVIQELARRTKTSLTFTNVPQTELNGKINTLMAANQLPDLVEDMGLELSEKISMFEDGKFVYLNDYVNAVNTPNIWKIIQENPAYKKEIYTDDGKLMGVYQFMERLWRCNWMVNNSFLTELNMQAPTDLNSLYDFLVAVKKRYPDAIPLGVGPWTGGPIAIKSPIMFFYNVDNVFRLFENDQYLFAPVERQNEYRDALKFINKLYREGLIDQEFFSRSDADATALISTNKVGMFWSWCDGFGLWGKGGSYGVDYLPNPPIKGPDGLAHVEGTPSQAVMGYMISSTCRDIPRALAFLDHLFSDEGADLINWGLEGQHYTVVNGQRRYTDLIMKNDAGPVTGRYLYGITPPHLPIYWREDSENAVNGDLLALAVSYYKQSVIFPHVPGLTPTISESEEFIPIMSDVNSIMATYEARIIQGSAADFDAAFTTYMRTLSNAGIQRAINIRRAQYERYKKR